GIDPEPRPVVRVGPVNNVTGLDAATGAVRWRCEGPGRVAALVPGVNPSGLSDIWFHTLKPEHTVCRQALPVGPDGRYGSPLLSSVEYGPPPEDPWAVVPLPWAEPAQRRWPQALLSAAVAAGLVLCFARLGKRRVALRLLACLLLVPLLLAGPELLHGW